jgi:putative salt-induced outer membrane protein YdiY
MRRLTKILLVTTICSSFVFGSSAQEESSQENKWGGDAALGFALARGNTNTTSFSLTLSAKGPISKSVINSNKAFFMLNREKEITNAESMGLESQINWQLTERFFSYYKILGIRDKFKNYSFRILPSVGIGYKVVATEKVQFSASTGLSEVFTKYYGSGDTDSYTGIALGNQLIWKISESAELSQTLDLNSDVSELSHYFLRFEMSLATAIAKGLSVKLTFMDNFDNKPVGEGIKKNDVSILAGLSAKF